MGQYHYIANIDKREYLHPHKFGDGLKLMEFGTSGSGTMLGLAVLLAASNGRGGGDLHIWTPSADDPRGYQPYGGTPTPERQRLYDEYVGRWAGDRIAIIGDYAEAGDFPGFEQHDSPWAEDPEVPSPTWTDISAEVVATIRLDYYVAQDARAPW